MGRSLEMVGKKESVVLHRQNPDPGHIMFAQGAPDASAALTQEPLARSDRGPPTLPRSHTTSELKVSKTRGQSIPPFPTKS